MKERGKKAKWMAMVNLRVIIGVFTSLNGDRYEGNWKDDIKDGFGKIFIQN